MHHADGILGMGVGRCWHVGGTDIPGEREVPYVRASYAAFAKRSHSVR